MNIQEICKYLHEDRITYYKSANGVTDTTFKWKKLSDVKRFLRIPYIDFDVKLQQTIKNQYMYFNIIFNYKKSNISSVCYTTKYKAQCEITSDVLEDIVAMLNDSISDILKEDDVTLLFALDKINKILSSYDGIKYSVESKPKSQYEDDIYLE